MLYVVIIVWSKQTFVSTINEMKQNRIVSFLKFHNNLKITRECESNNCHKTCYTFLIEKTPDMNRVGHCYIVIFPGIRLDYIQHKDCK